MKKRLTFKVASMRKLIAMTCFVTAAFFSWQPDGALAASKDKSSTLSLTPGQQADIWHRLGKQAEKTSVPAGLHVGEVVPDTMNLRSFARDIRKKIPAISSYHYVLLHNQILIISPRSKKIVFVVAE
jgi:hypothetical protein